MSQTLLTLSLYFPDTFAWYKLYLEEQMLNLRWFVGTQSCKGITCAATLRSFCSLLSLQRAGKITCNSKMNHAQYITQGLSWVSPRINLPPYPTCNDDWYCPMLVSDPRQSGVIARSIAFTFAPYILWQCVEYHSA